MKKLLLIIAGVALLAITNSFAQKTDDEVGMNIGLTSIYNKDTIDFSSFSVGFNYQLNSFSEFPIKPRLDFDYVSVAGFTNIKNLYKGSINGVYELMPDNVLSPYILGGFGYEYVAGAINQIFEDKLFIQGGVGIVYHQENGYNFKIEAKVLQIMDAPNQENEVILLAGVSVPISKFTRSEAKEDECPIKIDEPDEDRDGVTDMLDQCPNTPCYFTVDSYGCPIKATLMILFDTDKSIIKDESMPKVQRFAEFLVTNKGTTVEVVGHTDSDADDAYNIILSHDRAKSVVNQLISFGVSQNRLSEDGKGETMPVASNRTASGKRLNRRIEVKLTYPTSMPMQ
ncbi:MAG: OmpA family protein [Sulfurovum sp.]